MYLLDRTDSPLRRAWLRRQRLGVSPAISSELWVGNARPRFSAGLTRPAATRLLPQLPCFKRRLCETLSVTSARPELANRCYGTALEVVEHELADRR
jgi:hypothetical protein